MTSIFLSFNWMTFLMVAITIVLIVKNKAYAKNIRCLFIISLSFSLYLSVLSQFLSFTNQSNANYLNLLSKGSELVLRPLILIILIYLFIKFKRDTIDYVFTGVLLAILLVSFCAEVFGSSWNAINDTLCVVSCIFYYYCVMQTYKKDNLTRLPIRHNLFFEMDDIIDRQFDLVLIDVDDFKLINDRYGHDKGDETLVMVVNEIKKALLKGCTLYRFGGDEFVIVSKSVSRDALIDSLKKANESLAKLNIHFSYGIASHEKGQDKDSVITKADEIMYDHKKELKGDGIWDGITGLYSYRGFLEELNNFRRVVLKDGKNICLLAIDVEKLNNIIMATGYLEGNLVIKTVGNILDSAIIGKGFVGHLSGDEFVLALEAEAENDIAIVNYLDRVNDAIAHNEEFIEKDYTIKLNVGKFFVNSQNELSSEELINDVLYVKQEVKDNRNKHDIFDSDQEYDLEEEKLVMDILDNNKLRYAFQPIVSAKDGEIIAYESLMRSDTEQMISPLAIIKYAERNKRLYDIERYTFFNVFSRIVSANDFAENRRIFINSIPGYMLNDDDYGVLVEQYGDFLPRVVIEITEQREVTDIALATINQRRDKNKFNLAIDDYGSGYSNTNSLLRYMPQVIKLDRLLITGIERNAKKQFFVDSIISFARENDMMTLAEGVETESELKTVIRLGVDMIQGYFTAKPSFEIIDEIPEDIKRIIVDENIKVGGNKRMVYTASENGELSSVRLAMEDYSKINVSAEYIRIVGNKDYAADLVIRIKDGSRTHMTLCDVCLNSVDSEPCIELGENVQLTLNIEGVNKLNSKGIHVPDGSSLRIIGSGNLEIFAKGHDCYAIGSNSESGFGAIELNGSGCYKILVDGEKCVGIGGGFSKGDSNIVIRSGAYDLQVAGVDAVGIGSYKGEVPISINSCQLITNFRVNTGIIIGVLDGKQNISFNGFLLNAVGSGTAVCAIGSIHKTTGNISFNAGECHIRLNGQKLHLVGASEGNLNITSSHVSFEMIGEGDNVVGFGTFDDGSTLTTDESSLDLVINASGPHGMGLSHKDSESGFKGPLTTVKINGVSRVLGEEI